MVRTAASAQKISTSNDTATNDRLKIELARAAEAVSLRLDQLLPVVSGPEGRVVEAMRYASLNGGKRLRPFLTIANARLFDVPEQQALNAAAAIEMIHCYSLVHDDLPAMDDSDLRRGRPTAHKAFDEAVAILAGDGLLTEAFAVLSDPATHPDPAVRVALVSGLAAASGAAGMVGGQMIDMSPDRADLDLDGIKRLQALKTGALICFSCEAGAILGRANREEQAAVRSYAQDLGLAFQIVDDLLDAESSPEVLGKPTGQDEALGKATFVALLGMEGARREAADLATRAASRLDIFGEKADLLCATARFVVNRRS
ncbi:MAG: polyprenyl synthetase family protein [Kiloniellales bacterium]|nr:polyprenyl synthetase family protein [Kiloniellales bacterium]